MGKDARKYTENYYESLINNFKEDKKYQYELGNIKKAYLEIKKYYKEIFINNKDDIKYEKIRLEKKLGKHHGIRISNNFALDIAIIGVFISIFFSYIIKPFEHLDLSLILNISCAFFLIFIFRAIKNSDEILAEHLRIYMSLKILDELEKELSTNNVCEKIDVTNENIDVKIDTLVEDVKSIKRYIGIK
ncbi:hypothetical protein KQI86_16765 [Clostridium sp. MSJ-11]|uniref:SMODS and SLOG-associating 2TM effector domain-containing protein n=1 Tax=Clostridium mobile TaxID=2841512 RepID=A0ABS6ELS8_9CLOT|nr:hypothetical protein [Clostridium mobile]MBU5485975.1 hypothetical protein [Clostridium mobile]